MDAYIRNKNIDKNKSRYGKFIPKTETRIDIKEFFGRDDESFIKSLMNDNDLEFNLVKSAGGQSRDLALKLNDEKKQELILKNKQKRE